jgi:hypothetical protein
VTGTAEPEPSPRAPRIAAILLASAIVVGAVCLGAPPRFSAGTNGPEWLRNLFTTLTPLALVESAAAVALGILAASALARGVGRGRLRAGPVLPLVLLLALGFVQLVPLPRGVLEVVASYSARTYASLTAPGDDAWRPMSLWPEGTAHALFNLAGVIAASAATWALVRGRCPRRAAAIVLAFVVVVAAAEALTGFTATWLGDDRLLGAFEKVSGRGRVTGTFVHGTMMAVWAGMGACAALGLAAVAASEERRRRLAPVAVLLAAVCAAAGLFSLSRLGWIAVAAGALTTWLLVAASMRREGRRGAAVAMTACALVLVAGAVVVAFATPALRERFGYLTVSGRVDDPRFAMWRSTWDLFAEAPVVGTGLGSFGRAIHLTQSPDCAQELWFAHSDPLNLLSDAGVIGFVLGAWWVVAMLRRGLPSLRAEDARTRCLAAGAFGAAAVVLVAALGDFQTQFAVVAIPFAALLTVPAALAAPAPAEAGATPRRGAAVICLSLAAVAAALPLVASWRRIAELRESGVTGATHAESLAAQARSLLARSTSQDRRDDLRRAAELVRRAARDDPLLDDAHVLTAYTSLALGEPVDDVLRAAGRARLVARGHADTNLRVGRLYLETIGTTPAPHGPPGDGAVAALREAGEISPQTFSAAWALAKDAGMPLEVLRAITPPRGYAVATLADALRAADRGDEAIEVLRDQLAREPWDEAIAVRLAAAYTDTGRESAGRSFFDSVGARWPSPR